MSASYVWIAEAPRFPGTYALEPLPNGVNMTFDPNTALHFDSREACEAWIAKHSDPAWEPREHGFGP